MRESPIMTGFDILNEVVAPGVADLYPEAARSLPALKFTHRARRRMRKLLDRNNNGTMTPDDEAELDNFRRVGLLLDLLQTEARLSLSRCEH